MVSIQELEKIEQETLENWTSQEELEMLLDIKEKFEKYEIKMSFDEIRDLISFKKAWNTLLFTQNKHKSF